MVLTDDIWLPTDDELKHKEIPLTHNFFLSSAMWLGKYCDNQCKEFMLCRTEEMDPRRCLDEGREVTQCGLEFFRKVKNSCKQELEWYTKCLDFSGREPEYRRCRKEQAMFDGCMYENGFERAKFGHFNVLRVHDTKRPKPKRHVPVFPDSIETYDIYGPQITDENPQNYRGRMWWQSWVR